MNTNDAWNFLSDIDENLLSDVVSHHVLNGNTRSSDITADQMAPTLEGDEITFVSVAGTIEITDGSGNTGAVIEVTDIQASNGVIHVISNNVLIPETTN